MSQLIFKLFAIYVVTILLSSSLMWMMIEKTDDEVIKVTNQAYDDALPSGPDAPPSSDGIWLFAYVIAGAVVFMVLFRKFKIHLKDIIKYLEIFYIGYCFFMLGFIVMNFIGANMYYTMSIASAMGLFFAIWRWLGETSNMNAIVISAVIGAIIGGMLIFDSAIVFGVLMIVYDIIAVFWTKHMLTIAKEITQYRTAMVVTVTDPGHENDPPGFSEQRAKDHIPHRMDLGAGDLFMSSLLVSFSLKIPGMFWFTFPAAIVGFVATVALLKILNRPIPALPTIVGCILASMLAFKFLTGSI